MRIKFLKDAEYQQLIPPGLPNAGKPCPERSKSYKANEVYELPEDHANRWLRRNLAVISDEPVTKHSKKAEAMVPAAPAKGA